MILSIIGMVIIMFLAAGLFNASRLKTIEITKEVTIKAPLEKAFNMVRYLGNFPKWSPFLVEDPTQKIEVKGKDGTVGAQYHWEGNKGKDLGYQEIVKIDEYSFIGMKCDIQKPFTAHPTFHYHFSETQRGIRVIQKFTLHSSLADAFFMWLFGTKGAMDKTNEKGMQLLKAATEKG